MHVSSQDRLAIAAVLQQYFDGWHEADAEKLQQAFHPACHLYCVLNDTLDDDGMEKVYASVRARTSPKSRGEARHDRILAIEISSETLAMARVRLSIGSKLFTDNLSLLKIGGRWRIVAKVFSWAQLDAGADSQQA
jgi:hypothetical protein